MNFAIFAFIKEIGGLFMQHRIIKAKGDIEVTLARTNAATHAYQTRLEGDTDWERIMAENSGNSWKDEWLTLLLSVPLVMAFLGWDQEVKAGFTALSESVPIWWQSAFAVSVAAAFGVRKLSNLMGR